jgi:hypothetical protein
MNDATVFFICLLGFMGLVMICATLAYIFG